MYNSTTQGGRGRFLWRAPDTIIEGGPMQGWRGVPTSETVAAAHRTTCGMTTITTEALPHSRLGLVFGHPRGLVFLAGTELWDRISFHGMQALLVLYMVEQLLLPGHVERIVGFGAVRAAIESVTGPLSVQALATQIFGLYVGLVYVTPVFGGLLGDRVLGRRRAVALGALLMTAGHFCMAFDASFLLALLLLILGAGTLRGNLAPQHRVSNLRQRRQSRRLHRAADHRPAGAILWLARGLRLRGRRHAGRPDCLCVRPARPAGGSAARRLAHRPAAVAAGTTHRAVSRSFRAARLSLLDRAEPGLEHLQSLGARSRGAEIRQLDHAGAVAAIARRAGTFPVPAVGLVAVALAGNARPRARRILQDGDRLPAVRRGDLASRRRESGGGRERSRLALMVGGLSFRIQSRLALFRADGHRLLHSRGAAQRQLHHAWRLLLGDLPRQHHQRTSGRFVRSTLAGAVLDAACGLGGAGPRSHFRLWRDDAAHAFACPGAGSARGLESLGLAEKKFLHAEPRRRGGSVSSASPRAPLARRVSLLF